MTVLLDGELPRGVDGVLNERQRQREPGSLHARTKLSVERHGEKQGAHADNDRMPHRHEKGILIECGRPGWERRAVVSRSSPARKRTRRLLGSTRLPPKSASPAPNTSGGTSVPPTG